jgi:predicted negative regulator of RcsB-dependent stress response
MQKLFHGVLALLIVACRPAPDGLKQPKGVLPPIKLPQSTTEKNYVWQRQLYDALAVNSPGRARFRDQLLRYLLRRMPAFSAKNESALLRRFKDALTLYDPTEVYEDRGTNEALDRVAAAVIRQYAPRGAEETVLLSLAVRTSLNPRERASLQKKTAEVLNWVDRLAEINHGPAFARARSIFVMEQVAKVWPSPYVVELLHNLYLDRRQILADATSRLHKLSILRGENVFALFRAGYKVARIYLRVDRPYVGLQRLREIQLKSERDTTLRKQLELAVAPSANVVDYLTLAKHFENGDADVALRVCQAGAVRFPDRPEAHACVGRLGAKLNRIYLSVLAMEKAVALAPARLSYVQLLDRQYQRQIFQSIESEALQAARSQLQALERFSTSTRTRFGTEAVPNLAPVYYAMGHGFYNAGRIGEAEAALRQSLRAKVTPQALLQLSLIYVKSSDFPSALKELNRARALSFADRRERSYWMARSLDLLGTALLGLGDKQGARAANLAALEDWKTILGTVADPNLRAEAEIRRAKILFALGRNGAALDALENAIDANASRKETYAEVISLMTTHGHLPEALDAYHRALGRKEVTEYLKTYCSFWVINLARQAKRRPNRLALSYIQGIDQTKWYGKLAQLVLGKLSYEGLRRDPQLTPEKRAELDYYWAAMVLSKGRLEEAKRLWQHVLQSQMMAFFEYDMAWHHLRFGPASVRAEPVDRSAGGSP